MPPTSSTGHGTTTVLQPETPPKSAPPDRAGPKRWIVGPVADLACVINVFWLVYAGTQYLAFSGESPQLTVILMHFLVLPHRFITLGLVFLDKEQFSRSPRKFLGLPVLFLLLAFASRGVSRSVAGVDSFVCLAAIDYAWNAYHFSAQHYGMTRIYGKKGTGVNRPRLERWILVCGITYVIMRVTQWGAGVPALVKALPWIDLLAAAALLTLILLEVVQGVPSLPKLLYLVSVTALYGGVLFALHFLSSKAVAATVAATGFFHAMEYLSIVTFYVKSKARSGSWGAKLLSSAAGRWAVVLPGYMALMGLGTAFLKDVDPLWYILLVTPASFVHYAYDAMIWKLRKPQVAQALHVESAR